MKRHKFTSHQIVALNFCSKNPRLCMTLSGFSKYGVSASAMGALATRGYLTRIDIQTVFWTHPGWEPVAFRMNIKKIKEALEEVKSYDK